MIFFEQNKDLIGKVQKSVSGFVSSTKNELERVNQIFISQLEPGNVFFGNGREKVEDARKLTERQIQRLESGKASVAMDFFSKLSSGRKIRDGEDILRLSPLGLVTRNGKEVSMQHRVIRHRRQYPVLVPHRLEGLTIN